MPVNPYVDEMKACKFIDNFIMKNLKEIREGVHINQIVLQVKLLYPVSKSFIIKWIKEMYVESGIVIYDQNTNVIIFKGGD